MTIAVAPRVSSVAAPRGAAAVAAAGCALLLLRPLLVDHLSHPAALLATLFVVLAAVGMSWPTPSPAPSRIALPLVLGVAAFGLGRVVGGGHPPTTAVGVAMLGNTLAAVSEEAFFRRFLFGLLEPYGPGIAIAASAALFAAVHVTVYGLWVLPIDVAAGLILSWQRWATGSWAVPALTHVLANVLVVM